ncbi:hypothetical protein C8J57DRAFT_150486 [Mycena rebaudengoi]|nr:hypothetical protein C8J57DRAFT_150486 [Mycena rebaudengoi]
MGNPKKAAKHAKQSQLRPRTTRSSKGRLLSDPLQNTALLTEQLRSLGLYAAPTLGDGNCLFRALSDQLYGSPSRHAQLRKEVCDWIAHHKARYEPFVEDERGIEVHLRCMRENATYGGHMELSAFAHLTRRNVKVIQPGLVYVIEWASGGSPPASPTLPSPANHPYSNNPGTPSPFSSALSSPTLSFSSMSSTSSQHAPPAASLALLPAHDIDPRDRRRTRRAKRGEKDKGDRPIDVIDVDADEDAQDPEPDTVYVAYHDWEHFSSIRNLKGPHTGLPAVRETPPYPYAPTLPTPASLAAAAASTSTATASADAPPKKKLVPKVRLKLSSASPT